MFKLISKVEFFMPNGETKTYLTRQKVDGRYVSEITERESYIMISLVKVIKSEFSERIDTIHLTMPKSIPHSLIFSDIVPWSVRTIHDY